MQTTLTGHHKETYETIFRHPTSHNIEWSGLISVFQELGEVEEGSNGKIKFTRNGQTLSLNIHGRDVGIDEVLHIRHFLDGSALPPSEEAMAVRDAVVVIDHSGARIYFSNEIGVAPVIVKPIDPSGHDQQVHNPQGDSGGRQGSHRKMFFEEISGHLKGTGQIFIVSDGKGASSQGEQILAEFIAHHPELRARVAGEESIDLHHLTEPQMLAKVRDLFAK
jgi:hypothetical protein